MDPFEALDGLDLHHDRIVDEQIQAVTAVQMMSTVHKGQGFLALDLVAESTELKREAGLVRRFEHPGPSSV